MYSDQINGVRAYSKVIDNKVRVFLSYEDVLNRLGLITYNQIPDQKVVTDINGRDQYGYNVVVDYNRFNIYMAIMQVGLQDPDIVQSIPNPLLLNHYIPVELAIELARQCGNKGFEMEIVGQIKPALDGSNAINSAMALRSQIEPRQPVQQQYPSFRPTPDNPFQGNAYRIYYRYKDVIKYVIDLDQFMIYNPTVNTEGHLTGGGIWTVANESQFEKMLNKFEGELKQVAKTNKEHEVAQAFSNVTYTDKAVNKIKGIEECIITSSEFDKHPYLLNVLNGVVDLRTGRLIPADPNLYLTQQAPVMYKPYARSPLFEKFIIDILPDPDTREAVLRYLGYCLTGDTSAQKALFIIGSGANGKSTLLKVMTRLLGIGETTGYATSVSINLFNDRVIRSKSETTPDRVKIIKKRFVQVDEIKAGQVLDVGEFKLLTGSDAIPIRALYKKSETMVNPTHKFIFSGNFLPELRNEDKSDGGFIRRVTIAEFPNKFNVSPGPSMADLLTDPDSLSAILNILVAQAARYYQEGLYESPSMMMAKEEYVSGFTKIVKFVLESDYMVDPESYVLHSDLESVINRFMHPNKLDQYQLGRSMKRLGYESVRLKSGPDSVFWIKTEIR